jgi:hypothetical protein
MGGVADYSTAWYKRNLGLKTWSTGALHFQFWQLYRSRDFVRLRTQMFSNAAKMAILSKHLSPHGKRTGHQLVEVDIRPRHSPDLTLLHHKTPCGNIFRPRQRVMALTAVWWTPLRGKSHDIIRAPFLRLAQWV